KRILPHPGLGTALAHGPGRAVAEHGLLTEALDIGIVHVLEIVPGLVMDAGMGRAIPQIFRQVPGRLGHAAAAGPYAARRLAHAGFRLRLARLFRLGPDVAFETGAARLSHGRIMGSKA